MGKRLVIMAAEIWCLKLFWVHEDIGYGAVSQALLQAVVYYVLRTGRIPSTNTSFAVLFVNLEAGESLAVQASADNWWSTAICTTMLFIILFVTTLFTNL